MGGPPAPGNFVFSPTRSWNGVSRPMHAYSFGLRGPFVDYYLDPREGLHLQALLGVPGGAENASGSTSDALWVRSTRWTRLSRSWTNGSDPFRKNVEILTTMPGVGDVAANVIVSEIGYDRHACLRPHTSCRGRDYVRVTADKASRLLGAAPW